MARAIRLLCIQHDDDTGPGLLAEVARERGIGFDVVTPGSAIPVGVGDYNGLVVLGASPSVNDDAIAGWFESELALLRDADRRGVPVLGVCFGAQALAVALGGSVTRAERAEAGWITVDTVDPDLIALGPWLSWHVDVITPPPGATVIATTDVGVQAYVIGPHIAVQFHPEVTMAEISQWTVNDVATLESAGVDPEVVMAETTREQEPSRQRAETLMDRYLDRVTAATMSMRAEALTVCKLRP